MFINIETFRFVNSIISSNVEQRVIWSHISSLRYKYLKNNISPKCSNGFIFIKDILNNFEKMPPTVRIEDLEDMKHNFSKSEVNEAAKMFFALNSCPSSYEKLYSKVIYGHKSEISMLASNILKRTKENFKVKALKIFEKIISVLGFQHISYPHGQKNQERNIKLARNNLDATGP